MREEEKVVPDEDDVDIDGRPKTRTAGGDPVPPAEPENSSDDPTEDEATSRTPSTSSEIDDAPERATETQSEPWPRPR